MDWYNDWRSLTGYQADKIVELERKLGDLSRENMKLRQQRDAANAQLDFIISVCEEDLGLSEHLGIDIITTIKSLK